MGEARAFQIEEQHVLNLRRRNKLLKISRCWRGLTTEGVVEFIIRFMNSNARPKKS